MTLAINIIDMHSLSNNHTKEDNGNAVLAKLKVHFVCAMPTVITALLIHY